MGGRSANQEQLDALRRHVEELAATFVLAEESGGNVPEIQEALRLLPEHAARIGWEDGCRIAGELQRAVQAGGGAGCELAIARLQEALDHFCAGGGAEACPAESATETAPGGALAQDRELLSDFVLESREHLASIETHLLRLERDPGDLESIHAVFRSFHTIKGLAGFLEFGDIRDVAHEVETALDLARNGQLGITSRAIDVILENKDYLLRWMERLDRVLAGGAAQPAPPHSALLERVRALLAEPANVESGERPSAALESPVSGPPKAGASSRAGSAADAGAVKVDTAKLDFLVDMVGEMVIAQSLIRHDPDLAAFGKPRLVRNLGQLARITEEVQKTAMSMRMVPIKQLFHKMSRLVRDLGRKAGKEIVFETTGEETELDRHIVEELADPMMHMVRNAVDHGVEHAPERVAAGKDAAAKIRLSARHQSGRILIEVADDGRGLRREKILRKAVERGLIAEGAGLSDAEICGLIFQPGFSTAEKVTDVSGRGVGMDVVRRQITKLRGRVDIHSTPGAGTTFFIKLPLTLAIIDGLVVSVAGQRFILPISAVREVMQPTRQMMFTVENRAEMALVRNELIPVIRLGRFFGIPSDRVDCLKGVFTLVESDGRKYCLLVDELRGKQEVVIKSLGETFKLVAGISGGAILGDGRVGLILDVDAICGGSADAVR